MPLRCSHVALLVSTIIVTMIEEMHANEKWAQTDGFNEFIQVTPIG